MHQNLQRLPAERVRHRKRLPFQGWPDAAPLARQNKREFTATTFTQIIPINTVNTNTATSSTTTPVVPPINTSSSSSITPSLPSDTNTPSPPAAPIVSPPAAPPGPPSPIASAIPPPPKTSATEGAQNGPVKAVSQPHGLPTGAVVGITIACVMLILGAFIFFIRQRAVRNRKLRRATTQWMGPPRAMNGSFEPMTYPLGPPGNMSETSPGASFARAQVQAPSAVPAPVPTMPAPMPSSYNNPVPAVVPAGGVAATVRYEFIPSLPDELSITTGEIVRMVSEYDDGWALCKNGRGEQGMVPLECLDRGSPAQGLQVEQQDARNSRRTSSLVQY